MFLSFKMFKFTQRSCMLLQAVLEHQTPRAGAVAVRFLATKPSTNNKDGTPHVYKKTDHEYKAGKAAAMDVLQNLLNVKPNNAHNIIMFHENLRKTSPSHMNANFNMCKENGISVETITEYPDILAEPLLGDKLRELKKLPHDLNSTAPLIQLELRSLSLFVMAELRAGSKAKISELSRILKISKQVTCDKLVEKKFLRNPNITVAKIEKAVTLLRTEFGITNEQICNDLYSVLYSRDNVREKLENPLNKNIGPIKTWMIRSSPASVENYIKRRTDNKEILAGNSRAEYLAQRLECDEAAANDILDRLPDLKNKSLKLMRDIIDFLYSKQFTPQHITRSPKILVHSIATTDKRLKLLDEKNIRISHLSILTKSQKQFNEYVENQMKKKNKKWVKNDNEL